MANNNPQIPFHSILSHPENIPNHPHIPNHINNPPEENIFNDVVLNVSSPPTLSKEQINNSHEREYFRLSFYEHAKSGFKKY